jgi:hypothetical protein
MTVWQLYPVWLPKPHVGAIGLWTPNEKKQAQIDKPDEADQQSTTNALRRVSTTRIDTLQIVRRTTVQSDFYRAQLTE